MTGGSVNVSGHGDKRARKRAGLSRKSIARTCELVVQYGLHLEAARGRVAAWMTELTAWAAGDLYRRRVILYAEKAWVFAPDYTLVTVLNLPHDIAEAARVQAAKGRAASRSGRRRY